MRPCGEESEKMVWKGRRRQGKRKELKEREEEKEKGRKDGTEEKEGIRQKYRRGEKRK